MRVLLLYISEISGHSQACKAIEKALIDIDPATKIKRINGFNFTYPLIEKIVNRAYLSVIKRTPRLWDYLYDNPKVFKGTQVIKQAIHKSKHEKLAKLFAEFQPDTVICTQAFPCGMVADYKETYHLPIALIGVLTDFAPHSYWIYNTIDYYIVPAEEIKIKLINKGVDQQKIKVCGIPIDPKFGIQHDRKTIIKRLELDESIPTILIMGGGQGLGPIREAVRALKDSTMDFQLIVVAGTNRKILRWLKKVRLKNGRKILTYEFADNIDQLMEIASFVITKAGGMTVSESLAKGLPLMIVKPIPGQEMHNTKFLTEKKIACHVKNVKTLGGEIQRLLKDDQRLKQMAEAAFFYGRPRSAHHIAQIALNQKSCLNTTFTK